MTDKTKVQKNQEPCTAVQANRNAPDFHCKLLGAHSIHVDPGTGTRWGYGAKPKGWNRRWEKTYRNRKLQRASALGDAGRQSNKKKVEK